MASQNSEAVRVRIPVLQQEKSYKHWRNALLIWSLVTDVEPEKQALVVTLNLSGRARELALNIDSAELNKKTGLMTLLNLLDDRIQRLDAYRSFQKLDNLRKSPFQSMHVYVNSFEIFYESAEALGSSIPDKILAYKVLNGSDLSQERQEKILETTKVISVATISAALLSAGNWPWTKTFPETSANGSKQLQAICTQPNQSQHLRTQTSSLSSTSSKFSFSAFNGQTNVASADSTVGGRLVKVTELAASASIKDSSKNFFPGFSFSDTSLKNSPNRKQEVTFFSNLYSSLKSSLKKTNEDPSATDNAKPLPVTGPSKVDQKPGKWNGSDCYTKNEPTDAVCPCRGKANPNAPAAPKAESTGIKSGLISFGLNQELSYSYGIRPTTSNSAVCTGDEEQDAEFSERSKLYRWHESQWKERGIGAMKILRNKETGKYRLLMRIDQSLKICCNHVIEKSLNLQPMPNSKKAWIWHAMDFSEEEGNQEGLAIRFKTPEIANKFKAKFMEGQQANVAVGGGTPVKQLSKPASQEPSSASTTAPTVPRTGISQAGGTTARQQVAVGEQQVLFCHRAKLYCYVDKQWKERGVGDIKILHNTRSKKYRIVMKRDQILKLWANHYITSDMKLAPMSISEKAWTWTAVDHSDPVSQPQLKFLAVRFQYAETAAEFAKFFNQAKDLSDAKEMLIETQTKGKAMATSPLTATPTVLSFGAAATPAEASTPLAVQTQAIDSTTERMLLVTKKEAGSWNCPMCYSPNLATDLLCLCCYTPNPNKPKTDTSKTNVPASQTGPKFCFGLPSGQKSSTTFSFKTIFGGTPSATSFTPPQEQVGARTNAMKSLFPAATDTTVESNLFVSSSEILTPSDQSNGVFAVQTPDSQAVSMKSNETKPPFSIFGIHGNEYKPLPLATTSDVTKDKTALSQQSGKFQFKPASTDPTTQNNAKDIPVLSATDDDDDVVFVCELVPTDDQKKRAEKLLLPATFFLHENNPPPPDFDEKIEDKKEDKILKFIEDRDSEKLKLNEKTTIITTTTATTESSGSGDTTKTNTVKLADSSSTEEGWVFGGTTQSAPTFSSVGTASFGSLSSGVQNLGFTKDPSFQFPGAGKVMFVSQTTEEGDDHTDPASFKSDAQFKPVLEELPPLIEVKTGEEGEEIVFKERCKLYRYDKDAKAWKERGVGEIKILRNDEYKLYRVVMRRDQVLKVCTNHVINETTDPELHLGSTKSCSYFVMDYSESKTPTPEKIAIRFKLDKSCKTYMDKIAEIKHLQESQS